MRGSLRALASGALALVVGLLLLALGLHLAGYDAGAALAALWNGAFGSWRAFTGATLLRAVPLILMGLGFALALRGGALNIGAEGQFYARRNRRGVGGGACGRVAAMGGTSGGGARRV